VLVRSSHESRGRKLLAVQSSRDSLRFFMIVPAGEGSDHTCGRTCACRTAKVATSHPAAQPSGACGDRSLDGRGGEMNLQPAAPTPPRSDDPPMHSTRAYHAAKPRIALPILHAIRIIKTARGEWSPQPRVTQSHSIFNSNENGILKPKGSTRAEFAPFSHEPGLE
jgi:hypothetical protein